jgi:hypothetical protein
VIKVAGLWELGYSAPLNEYDVWHVIMRAFEVDEWCMSPVSGLLGKQVTERAALETFIDENPDFTPVAINEHGDIPLQDFTHPENALYVLGKVGRSTLSLGAVSVRVPVPSEEAYAILWPHQILSIVLYDRQVKNGLDRI